MPRIVKEKKFKKTFGNTLSKLIPNKDGTIPELARKINVDASTIYNWKKGGQIPDAEDHYHLARALGVSMEYLLTGIQISLDETVLQGVNSVDVTEDRLKSLLSELEFRLRKDIDGIKEDVAKMKADMEIMKTRPSEGETR